MICSLNEIGGGLKKAAIGAGYPVGLADDVAAAGVWLCARGHDGVGAALAALATPFTRGLARSTSTDGGLEIATASVARCGLSPFELLVAGDAAQVTLEGLDSPLLLVGLAGVAARVSGSTFDLTCGSVEVNVGTSDATPPDVSGLESGAVTVTVGPSPVAAPGTPTHGGVEVDDVAWADVLALAALTYVPATEESRLKGAGAGLTDND